MPEPDDRHASTKEPGRDGASRTSPRAWTITIVVAVALLGTMYGVATHRAEVRDEQRQTDMQRDASAPASPSVTRPGG